MRYLVYSLSKRVDLSSSVKKLAKFSSNTDKVKFEYLYIQWDKRGKNLGLTFNSKIDDAPLYDLLRKDRIKYDNQLMVYLSLCLVTVTR